MNRKIFMLAGAIIALLLLAAITTAQAPRTLANPAATAAATMQGTAAADDSNPCASVAPAATAAPTKAAAKATAPAAAGTEEPAPEIARPSNAGGPGPALKLVGDIKAGAKVFVDNCQKCHGEQGVGGIANPGSTDGTIPALNPIDETLVDKDAKVFACNVDLFIEHGSTPGGDNPKEVMAAWGDDAKLTPQQIADVVAYVMSLNNTQATGMAAATAAK